MNGLNAFTPMKQQKHRPAILINDENINTQNNNQTKPTITSSSSISIDCGLSTTITANAKSSPSPKRQPLQLTSTKVSERSERALMKTSLLAMNPAKWLQT